MALAALATVPAADAGAQGLSAWLQPSMVYAPPPGSHGFSAANLFGLVTGGVRLEGRGRRAAELTAGGGHGLESESGGWVHGAAGAELATRSASLDLRLRAEAFGLGYLQSYDYSVGGAAVRPRITTALGRTVLTLDGYAAAGRWRQEAPEGAILPPAGLVPVPGTTKAGALRLYGGRAEVGRRVGGGWFRVGAEAYDTRQGPTPGRTVGSHAELSMPAGGLDVSAGAGLWWTPEGADLTGRLVLSRPLGPRASVYATASRSPVDPLYGTPAGPVHGVGLDVRLQASSGAGSRLAVVGEALGDGRRVTFRLRGVSAERVAVAGDFSGWEALPMERSGDGWFLDTVLEPGAHNFSFVLDGEHWYVPPDAPGQVSDGWGRRNAVILVEEP